MKRVLSDQSALKAEMFEHVPWLIAAYLWDNLGKCMKQTLHMWKIMTRAYPEFRRLHPCYHMETVTCKQPLRRHYFDIMNSEDCIWRGVLSFPSNLAEVADFVAIANVKNLVALQINPTYEVENPAWTGHRTMTNTNGIQDGVVRGWLEMAETHGSFQHMRYLRMEGQNQLTPHVLTLLRKLPQLQHIVISKCDLFTKKLNRIPRLKGQDAIEVDGWIVRRQDWIVEKEGPEKAKQAEAIREMYKGGGSVDYQYFVGMEPLTPYSLSLDTPVMDLDISRRYDLSFVENPTQLFVLVRGACERTGAKKRLSEKIEGTGPRKRVMKDRGQDLAGLLDQFM
ncbi:uncharacterized protein N7484_003965 [Penicillium longicatenatum]|uniref:uncharacterized protein n=1 Tax=Penicillium longicatenatum TaxID=1561947 RepID=UPI002546B397|nr:uncharacterized protein N7484_003965 [Penicillium longicatenatum]KAJ5650242.1 hypothetical protein N7484_003965 [Penicillium longicatenatum]